MSPLAGILYHVGLGFICGGIGFFFGWRAAMKIRRGKR